MNTTQNQDAPAEQDWLDEAVQDMLVQYTAWTRGEPVAWNFKKAEAKAVIRAHIDQQIAERVQAEVVKKLESLYHNQAFGKDCSFCTANSYTMLDNIRQLAALSKEQLSE